MTSNINQDLVLRSFYEERRSRTPASKRHSLLQKNLSYFSNKNDENAKISKPASNKHLDRKKNLQEYEQSLKQITSSINNMRISSQSTQHKRNQQTSKHKFIQFKTHQKFQSPKQNSRQNTQQLSEYCSPKFNMTLEPDQSISPQKQKISKYLEHTLKFNESLKRLTTEHQNGQNIKIESKQDFYNDNLIQTLKMAKDKNEFPQFQNTSTLFLTNDNKYREIELLKAKIEDLEKLNRKQGKFIQSVYKMRKTIQKTEDDCNLKDLWRWVKKIPNIQLKTTDKYISD